MSINMKTVNLDNLHQYYHAIVKQRILTDKVWPSALVVNNDTLTSKHNIFAEVLADLRVISAKLFGSYRHVDAMSFVNDTLVFNGKQLQLFKNLSFNGTFANDLSNTWHLINNLIALDSYDINTKVFADALQCVSVDNVMTTYANAIDKLNEVDLTKLAPTAQLATHELQYVRQDAATIFNKKFQDYGNTWSIMRPITLCDQMLIKIKRLVQLQTPGYIQKVNEVGDDQRSEFIGVMNYSFMLHYQMQSTKLHPVDAYCEYTKQCAQLQAIKDSDYGTAWKDLAIESITDLIYAKLLRIKNAKSELSDASENILSNVLDVYNYCTFALYLMSTTKSTT